MQGNENLDTVVETPYTIDKESIQSSRDLHSHISKEFKKYDQWTIACTNALQSSPLHLMHYDRFQYILGNAFGNKKVKIALNPLMLLCYHPECLGVNKLPPKLHDMNNLRSYIHHLFSHTDKVGRSMQIRFQAVYSDPFITSHALDQLFCSPFSLLSPLQDYSPEIKGVLKRYAIKRDLKGVHYLCHWKSKLIANGVITSSSLSFQEDDALLELYFRYPNPVDNWNMYKTLTFYFLKTYCYISSTAVNLLRGVTDYCRLSGNDKKDVTSFVSDINHPGPAVNTLHRWLSTVSYENEQFHPKYLLFHKQH